MKDQRDLKDLTINDVKPISDKYLQVGGTHFRKWQSRKMAPIQKMALWLQVLSRDFGHLKRNWKDELGQVTPRLDPECENGSNSVTCWRTRGSASVN